MTVDTIRAQAEAFDRRSRREDIASFGTFAFIIAANAITIVFERDLIERLGDLLTILASLYILATYYWRAREAPPAALGTTPSIDFYRHNIVRRQAMYGRFWLVVLLFLPGILLSTVGDVFMSPHQPSQYVALAVGFAGLVVGVEWLNRRAARRLSAELDSLDRESR